MKPVFQTRFDESGTGPGNCMQAAAASMLELPLSMVPNFIDYSDSFKHMREFFERYGIQLVEMHRNVEPHGLYFETGISTQGHEHIVLCRGGRLVHDPNPHGRGLVLRRGVIWPKPLTDEARDLLG